MPHLVAHRLGEITPGSAPERLREVRRRAEQAAHRARLDRTEDTTKAVAGEDETRVRAQGLAFVRDLATRNPREAEEWARRMRVPWPLNVVEGEA